MQKRLISLCLAGAAGVFSLSALAGGYAGLGVGQASMDETVTLGGNSGTLDDDDIGWKLFGGYFFMDNLGIEAGYADLGSMTDAGTETKTDGFYAAAIGSLPLGDSDFSLHAKLGMYQWDQDISVGSGGLASHDGHDAMYGVGAKYVMGGMFGVQLDWERYNADYDSDLISLGLTLNF